MSAMEIVATEIEDVKVIVPQVFGDARGWFVEQYNAARYKEAGIGADFVQDNESLSSKAWCAASTGRPLRTRRRNLCA